MGSEGRIRGAGSGFVNSGANRGRGLRVLFVYPSLQSFVQRDLDILRSAHEVRPIQFTGRKELAKQLLPNLWRLWQGALWCDLSFSWFGKLHALFAVTFSKALGKKAVVVSGGDEVADESIGGRPYGLCSHPLKKRFAYLTFGKADLVLAVSRSNLTETLRNARADPERTRLIYHGFDGEQFRRLATVAKNNSVATVVANVTEETIRLKSLTLFVNSARLLPETKFHIVGPDGDRYAHRLKDIAPPNVTFWGGLYGQDLVNFLSRTAVYVQASSWESFGCALAEAMLCECVPVVSNRYSLPEVAGDCAFYVHNLEPEELAAGIQHALHSSPEMGRRARNRILETFPAEKRRNQLLTAIDLLEKA